MGVPTLRCDTPQSVASVVEREDKLRKFDPILSDLRSYFKLGERLSFLVPKKITKWNNQDMNKISQKCFVLAVASILAGSAFAAEKESSAVTPNLDKGTKVLEGAGNINFMADEIQIQVAYGEIFADGIEVAVVAGLRDNEVSMSTELGVRGEYNLAHDSAFVPFLSAGVVWANAENDDTDVDTDAAVFSVGGGVKYFIRDDVALAVNGSYVVATDDIFVDNDEVGEVQDDEFRVLLSVRSYFD